MARSRVNLRPLLFGVYKARERICAPCGSGGGVQEVADHFLGIVSHQGNGVLEEDGVVLIGRGTEGNTSGGCDIKPNQTERLMPAVDQRLQTGEQTHAPTRQTMSHECDPWPRSYWPPASS
jgi:hypothetical protein